MTRFAASTSRSWINHIGAIRQAAADHLPLAYMNTDLLSPPYWDNLPIAQSMANAISDAKDRNIFKNIEINFDECPDAQIQKLLCPLYIDMLPASD